MTWRPLRGRCVFRVAAGPRVGYGHLMRAAALMRCLEMDVAISLRGGRAAEDAARAIAPVIDEADAWREADVLVVDDPSRAHGAVWVERARRRGLPVASVHDDEHVHDADLAVCGALGVTPLHHLATPVLQGTRYCLLDPGIAAARRRSIPARAGSRPAVLIALGGGRHVVGVAQTLVDAVRRRAPSADIAVAAGFSAGDRPALRDARWLVVRTGLTQALCDADAAIVAGGVTLYEACALGVPSVALAVVPPQRRAIRAFARAGAVLDAGGSSTGLTAIRCAATQVARLLTDPYLRDEVAGRARRLVDGRGAERVAGAIHALVNERLALCA